MSLIAVLPCKTWNLAEEILLAALPWINFHHKSPHDELIVEQFIIHRGTRYCILIISFFLMFLLKHRLNIKKQKKKKKIENGDSNRIAWVVSKNSSKGNVSRCWMVQKLKCTITKKPASLAKVHRLILPFGESARASEAKNYEKARKQKKAGLYGR